MNTTSKWGGYGASFFSIVCFGEGMAYAVTHGELPDWFAIVTGSSFLLGTISGTICLGAALVDHLRHKRNSRPVAGNEVAERTAQLKC